MRDATFTVDLVSGRKSKQLDGQGSGPPTGTSSPHSYWLLSAALRLPQSLLLSRQGAENTWFHSFCKKRSQDGNPGPKIEILVLALLVGFGPCELSWSVSITYNYLSPFFLFLFFSPSKAHLWGARGSVLPLSCLPLGPQPFLGPIPIFLRMSHSGLAAGILIKGLNFINSHVPVLFVQREKGIKRNSLCSWKSRWGS